MDNLVIVESPTKARTLSRFLGPGFRIEASAGHVRDLPKSQLGIEIDNGFRPLYVIPRDKKKKVNELKKVAQSAKTLWLATDPDREGEAIAWHITELLRQSKSKQEGDGLDVKRVVFHEITPEAVKNAFAHPRQIDQKLVDAQQARRILDRLVGYKLSPLLWKKVKRGLSAGRVQSVALRLIVEREREIAAFEPKEYWTIEALLHPFSNPERSFFASLVELNGQKLEISTKQQAQSHVDQLQHAQYQVTKIISKQLKRTPPPPFTTSTLQQTAGNRLGFSAKKTMTLAQQLYEHGLITYMRTDSVNLSTASLTQARDYILGNFGPQYLPPAPRVYKAKSKLAQEAHEAIRPTNIFFTPPQLKNQEGFTRDHVRLYELIWKRMLACQIADSLIDQTIVEIEARSTLDPSKKYLFKAIGSQIKFDGWIKVYGIDSWKDEEEREKKQNLPVLSEQEQLNLVELKPEQHFTEPPPRYTEASLIKKLEELGIGRPSTYAPIISTLQERYYVKKQERKFFSTPLGIAVNDFLLAHFPEIMDYRFTANMEDQLDEIARGQRKWQPTINDFYQPFAQKLNETEAKVEKIDLEIEKVEKDCPECGRPLVVRFGRYGKFLACSGFPQCTYTETMEEVAGVNCPQCGGSLVIRRTKKGKPFFGCKNYPSCNFASWTKPKP